MPTTLLESILPLIWFCDKCLGVVFLFCGAMALVTSNIKMTPEEQAELDRIREFENNYGGPPFWGDPH